MNYRALEFSTNKETNPSADRAETLDAFVGALNLRLHCLVASEFKRGKFKAEVIIRGPYMEQYEKCREAMLFLGEQLLQHD